MRTQKEIIDRINNRKQECLFGWGIEDLIFALSFENAQKFFKDDHTITKEEWNQYKEANIISSIRHYIPFAIEKAVNHRGISASRSVSHFRSWVWLLGNDELSKFIDNESNYMQYGAPIIKRVAEEYGDIDSYGEISMEDEIFAAMANGEICPACRNGHSSGCGE